LKGFNSINQISFEERNMDPIKYQAVVLLLLVLRSLMNKSKNFL